MQLIIGNKNYSSWSLRPWLLMKAKAIPFTETLIGFEPAHEFQKALAPYDAKTVPVLIDGDYVVRDTLAITEYLHEQFPDKSIYPEDIKNRLMARSLCAEMHSSFIWMRQHLPMNIRADYKNFPYPQRVKQDIDRVLHLWTISLQHSGGTFLFGDFCAADAFYAPVVMRFATYDIKVPPICAHYMQSVINLPAMQEWIKASQNSERIEDDEMYV